MLLILSLPSSLSPCSGFGSVLQEICGILIFSGGIDIFLFDGGLLLVLILYNDILFWFVTHDWIPLFVEIKIGCAETIFREFKSPS